VIDWDDAYANMAHIPNGDALPARWLSNAAAYRASAARFEEHSYGPHPREKFDVVWPDATPKGLAVFVHGGYWLQTDKSYWSDLAEGARAAGWAVCLPSAAAALVAGPIRLAGHSAGGHLVSRMMCADTSLDPSLIGRIAHTLSISGLHDLRPLLRTKMNVDLHLDLAEATAESAALNVPHATTHVTTWVGGGERPEFLRQAELLPLMWGSFDVSAQMVVDAGHDHFSVLDGLKRKDSDITKAFVGT